jgi:hypothetical protein
MFDRLLAIVFSSVEAALRPVSGIEKLAIYATPLLCFLLEASRPTVKMDALDALLPMRAI